MVQILKITPSNFHKSIDRAVSTLTKGGIVAFPTDTVYGLGVDAFNPKAALKIYEAKRRPKNKPLPILIASLSDMSKISADLPPVFEKIAAAFWPGALTLVVKASSALPPEVTAGLNTVGVRMPDNPIALELIGRFGKPLATTSANLSGEKEAVTAKEVYASLGDKIELILDGGLTKTDTVSTVLDISKTPSVILRKGQITESQISQFLEITIEPRIFRPR